MLHVTNEQSSIMRKIKKISIITLTYKNWRLLDRAIDSVKLQIIENKYEVEYFIVDDGTEDFDQTQVQNNAVLMALLALLFHPQQYHQ